MENTKSSMLETLRPELAAATEGSQAKFLVQIVERVGRKHAFFGFWFVLVGGFVLLMMAYYRKQTRRNFREPETMSARQAERKLPPLKPRGP